MQRNVFLAKLQALILALGLVYASFSQAENLEFNLINNTSADLIGFYISHTGTGEWEENLLNGSYLPAGYEISVLIADGLSVCEYDIRGEFSDDGEADDFEIDLCDLGEYAFYD